ncbi:MAG: bifunctional 3-deoxy-7-phosphoheptulonate synthase/chorismate mutase type II [Bacteroidetes bacterium]|nr:bifunctional 3-deoxy-7-phosphoheptulonate synthase/chorismate mutase type II [Bacteroidota bacterium]
MVNIQPLHSWITNSPAERLIIAGPCGAESEEQVLKTAQALSHIESIRLFRAGIWKPRTRPNSFEGVGEEGLIWLKKVQQQFGLKTTVEVANAQHTELALKHGVDVLWIGARTTGNPFSVQEIADVVKGVDIPVFIKNPIHADLQLWLGAIERLSNSGITKLAAIHRGFHYSGKTKYRNKPLWEIAIELKTLLPELPIICDPSHISGNRELIPQVAQKALDLGMNGLMIESHINPAVALSDAQQQLTPLALKELLGNLVYRQTTSQNPECSDKLSQFRSMIDEVDDELMNVLKKRMAIIEQIGQYKKEQDLTIFQLERWQEILRSRLQWAEKLGIPRGYAEKICQLLHEESIRIQTEMMNKK